ncbi:MAG: hypothetical protein CMQ24_17630 [Gammaproteobacteria bacterium]|nr:hypothetical protein [Gammaproteobacteria bacterium]
MKYSNPQLPEGINTSESNPLAEFALLGGGALFIIALVTGAISFSAGHLAALIPYSWETKLLDSIPADGSEALVFVDDPDLSDQREHLQALSVALASHQDLPDAMQPVVHLVRDPTRNAFATLGGHIVIYTGLLADLPSENALAMVLAHEIAHLKHRDPIRAAGRTASVTLVMALLLGATDTQGVRALAGMSTEATLMAFSRSQERQADATALASVAAHYGHVTDADWLFRESTRAQDARLRAFFATHPLDAERADALQQLADEAGWARAGEAMPLPVW